MCELLGMSANVPTDIVFSFTGLMQRGGLTGPHRDGWGIAFFEGHGVRHFVDHQSASQSPIAELIRRYPIQSRNVIAHIRKATQGVVSLENCHPFVRELWGRYWVFAHNGNLENYAPRLHGNFKPVGQTDSELAFCWLMQELAKAHCTVPSIAELSLTRLTPQNAEWVLATSLEMLHYSPEPKVVKPLIQSAQLLGRHAKVVAQHADGLGGIGLGARAFFVIDQFEVGVPFAWKAHHRPVRLVGWRP